MLGARVLPCNGPRRQLQAWRTAPEREALGMLNTTRNTSSLTKPLRGVVVRREPPAAASTVDQFTNPNPTYALESRGQARDFWWNHQSGYNSRLAPLQKD
jgi:hypothetical protein